MKDKLIKILSMIEEDMERDVRQFEGKEFNGRNVSTQLGNQAAAISALANVIKATLEEVRDGRQS